MERPWGRQEPDIQAIANWLRSLARARVSRTETFCSLMPSRLANAFGAAMLAAVAVGALADLFAAA
jgi:hypothetical protein